MKCNLPLSLTAIALSAACLTFGCKSMSKGAATIGIGGTNAPSDATPTCEKCADTNASTPSGVKALCSKCGEVKGGKKCCKPAAAKCGECGLNKGSPACCKVPAPGKKMFYCANCGNVSASAPSAVIELCKKCGKPKGSKDCCKPE